MMVAVRNLTIVRNRVCSRVYKIYSQQINTVQYREKVTIYTSLIMSNMYRIVSYRNVHFWGASSKTPAPRP